MSNFFGRMLGHDNKGSSSTAKDRLRFVLVHDRINLPPERLEEMKEEILAVISKYVPVDTKSVDIALEQRDRNNSKLVAEIPFMNNPRGQTRITDDGHDNDDLQGERPKSDQANLGDQETVAIDESGAVDEKTDDSQAEESAKDKKADAEPANDDDSED